MCRCDRRQQDKIFEDFLDNIEGFSEYHIYHFGSYETTALRIARQKMSSKFGTRFETVLKASVNVLSVIYPHIYFPIYSNGLKHIGKALGYQWTHKNASGARSIVWRENWEDDKSDAQLKKDLILYNAEDCMALKVVNDFILSLSTSRSEGVLTSPEGSQVIRTDDLRQTPQKWHPFRDPDFVVKDLDYVNKCAYFDYQPERVYVRPDKTYKKIIRRESPREPSLSSPAIQVHLSCQQCPTCSSKQILKQSTRSRNVVDLNFVRGGVRKVIKGYISEQYRCTKCRTIFVSPDLPGKKAKYGHALRSWYIYHNVARKENMLQVSQQVFDLFGIHIVQSQLYRFKTSAADYYEPTYSAILRRILGGPVIHADETAVKLKGDKGYI